MSEQKLREVIARARDAADQIDAHECPKKWTVDAGAAERLRLLADTAESTLPKTKEVEVWRVFGSTRGGSPWCNTYTSETDAASDAENWRRDPNHTCICLTGPHKQEVPA